MQSFSDFLSFSSLTNLPGLQHSITTRSGGVSEGPYASLNLGYHVGDDAAQVTQNRQHLGNALGYDAASLVCAQQVHEAQAVVVNSALSGQGALDWQSAVPATDALIVQESKLPILILVADCAPLLMVDPIHHVLAVVHAGWRGAVAGVSSNVLACLQQQFQSHPNNIRVGIGPCLCPDCFEIGAEVAEVAASVYAPAVIPPAPHSGRQKPQLNLRGLLTHQLHAAGVKPENIEALPHCPRCMPKMFFSHRCQQGTAGRFGLVAWWS